MVVVFNWKEAFNIYNVVAESRRSEASKRKKMEEAT